MNVQDTIASASSANGVSLGPDGSKTIFCPLAKSDGTPPSSADIALVVDYSSWIVPFYTFRKYERFVGQYGDHWQWLEQPSTEIESSADQRINDLLHESHN